MCWVKLHRSLLEWEWYHDLPVRVLFIHLILSVNYEDRKWKGEVIPRGSMVTSIASLAEGSGLSVKQIRTAMEKLKSTNDVVSKGASKYSIVTVCNYERYQGDISDEGTQRASKGQAKGKQRATLKEIKNIEYKENISKDISKKVDTLGEEVKKVICKEEKMELATDVKLTQKEYDTLVEKYGEVDTLWMIKKLSAYKLSSGKKYKSDYGAINSWVIDRLKEQKEKTNNGSNRNSNGETSCRRTEDFSGREYTSTASEDWND